MNKTAYTIKYALWPDGKRWRQLNALQRAYVEFWGWMFSRLWRGVLRPHVMPRRYANEEYRHRLHMRLPQHIHGFVWEEVPDGFVGQFLEDNGPWHFAVFVGDTEEEAREQGSEMLRWVMEYAGARDGYGPGEGSYSVQWHSREPNAADRSWTGNT